MLRRQFLGSLAAVPAIAQNRTSRPPNILFIMSDDHASHAISAYGSRINKTPNIDRLATEGVKLTNCFCTNSICTPSRASILTGQYSHVNGVKTLSDPLDPARQNVAKLLQSGGYSTAIVGKWHLHKDPAGFDHWNIVPGQGLYHDPVFVRMGDRKKHTGYATDLITDFSIDWMKQRPADKPFFLMCHHKAPHRPFQPSAKYAQMFEGQTIPEPDNLFDDYKGRSKGTLEAQMRVGEHMRPTDVKRDLPKDMQGNDLRRWAYQHYIKDYLRCVQSVDDSVGRLLDYLKAEDLDRDTVVIYTSDQGFFLGDHGWYDKRFMYEESLRMPFLVRYPREFRAGSVNRDITLNVDFAEFFLDVAGLKPPDDMQGRSFRANLRGQTPRDWRQSMYYRYWMHADPDHNAPAHYGIRTQRHKLIRYYNDDWELFDMDKDPREMRNLYADPEYRATRDSLKRELDKLRQQYGDTAALS